MDQDPLGLLQFVPLKDGILAYEFVYPTEAAGRKIALVTSRKPERYSSAAPLSADAKQRIVTELVDFSDRATISVTVWAYRGGLSLTELDFGLWHFLVCCCKCQAACIYSISSP